MGLHFLPLTWSPPFPPSPTCHNHASSLFVEHWHSLCLVGGNLLHHAWVGGRQTRQDRGRLQGLRWRLRKEGGRDKKREPPPPAP